MPNEAGAAVRAIDHAAASGLAPLELHLAGDVALVTQQEPVESERDWLARPADLAGQPPLPGLPHADALHRLAQAVASLQDARLWPW